MTICPLLNRYQLSRFPSQVPFPSGLERERAEMGAGMPPPPPPNSPVSPHGEEFLNAAIASGKGRIGTDTWAG